jgi:replicative DNA helicase
MMEIRAKARRLRQRHDLRLIVVDYLQLMTSAKRVESRQVEVSELSRSLKLLAKEIDVPVVAISQLNRGPEQRTDKRPMLSDLRECLTGDTLVARSDTGERVPIRELVGAATTPVWSLDERLRVRPAVMQNVRCTGTKPVKQLTLACGRVVTATDNHPFLTVAGWRPVADLAIGDSIAVARELPNPETFVELPQHELVMLAHLVGDGCPALVHRLPMHQVAEFLHHLWSTDGSVGVRANGAATRIYYATTSRALADDVQALLLRLGIGARLRTVPSTDHRTGYTVDVSGRADQLIFLGLVGVHGARSVHVDAAFAKLVGADGNPNVDVIPADVWDYIRKAMLEHGVTTRQLAKQLDMSYCGSALYKSGLSRDRMARVAAAVPDPFLRDLAGSDVRWEKIVSIEHAGEAEVYDAFVPGTHSFLAGELVSHNSGAIEQDADMVVLLHREDFYEKESPRAGEADLIVAKNRNGPTRTVTVAFQGHYSRFVDMQRS